MTTGWWNLDQGLLWTATRNDELVEAAGGHPSNPRQRDGGWLHFWLTYGDDEEPAYGLDSYNPVSGHERYVLTRSDSESQLLSCLASGCVSSVNCRDFQPIHPGWFLGSVVDYPSMEENDPDRINIARLSRFIDGALPPFGAKEVYCVIIDADALRKGLPGPGSGGTPAIAPPQRQPRARAGRPLRGETVDFMATAAGIVMAGFRPATLTEFRAKALEKFAEENPEKDDLTDEWAKDKINALWDEMKLDPRHRR